MTAPPAEGRDSYRHAKFGVFITITNAVANQQKQQCSQLRTCQLKAWCFLLQVGMVRQINNNNNVESYRHGRFRNADVFLSCSNAFSLSVTYAAHGFV